MVFLQVSAAPMPNGMVSTTSMDHIASLVRSLKEGIQEGCGDLKSFALLLAGLAALIYVANLILPTIERGERINIYPYLKPFIIAFFIVNFDGVVDFLDMLFDGFGNLTKNFKDAHPYNLRMIDQWSIEFQQAANEEVHSTGFPSVSGMAKAFGAALKNTLYTLLFNLSYLLGLVVKTLMSIMAQLYLAVLAIFGPLALAVSLFNGFSSTFNMWLGRYINVGLWMPLFHLVDGVNAQLMEAIFSQKPTEDIFLFSVCLSLFSIVLYTKVPTLSSMIIEAGGGMGNLHRGMTSIVTSPAGMAANAGMGKVGAGVARGAAGLARKGADALRNLLTRK